MYIEINLMAALKSLVSCMRHVTTLKSVIFLLHAVDFQSCLLLYIIGITASSGIAVYVTRLGNWIVYTEQKQK